MAPRLSETFESAKYSTPVTLMDLSPNQLNPPCPAEALLGDHSTSLTLAPRLPNQLNPPDSLGCFSVPLQHFRARIRVLGTGEPFGNISPADRYNSHVAYLLEQAHCNQNAHHSSYQIHVTLISYRPPSYNIGKYCISLIGYISWLRSSYDGISE